jgi:hypothetical protein
MRLTGHVACGIKTRNSYRILAVSMKEREKLEDVDAEGY